MSTHNARRPAPEIGTSADLHTLADQMRALLYYGWADRVLAAAEAMRRMEEFCDERGRGEDIPLAAALRQMFGAAAVLSVVQGRTV